MPSASAAARTLSNPPIGAHVSTAGHIDIAAENAEKIGAEAVQIFGAAPQQWRRKEHPPEDIAAFREKMAAADIGPNFIHAIYLVNLASADAELVRKGVDALIADMRLASALGIAGVIFHVGSHKGAGFRATLPQIAEAMRAVLEDSPDDVWLCIENNAGTGNSVGSSFQEIGAIMDAVDSGRVKVCLDTCHAHSAGYNFAEPEAFHLAMSEFGREIGLSNLVAVHANDSKTPFRSRRDRHENIGRGSIGLSAFGDLIRHPAFARATWLLEVPGFEGGGPDALNVRILKALRDGTPRPRIPRAQPNGAAKKVAAEKRAAKRAPAKKGAAKKTAAKKLTAKKAAGKRRAVKKTAAKKRPAKRSTAKRTASRKASKRSPARKGAGKRGVAKKRAARTSAAKKPSTKKTGARKTAAGKRSAQREAAPSPGSPSR
ncbi:MAG: deoxyribonuclease IV [Dehalococcoidia bacterium]